MFFLFICLYLFVLNTSLFESVYISRFFGVVFFFLMFCLAKRALVPERQRSRHRKAAPRLQMAPRNLNSFLDLGPDGKGTEVPGVVWGGVWYSGIESLFLLS